MVWLDLDAKPALNIGTPSVEVHWGAVGLSCVDYLNKGGSLS